MLRTHIKLGVLLLGALLAYHQQSFASVESSSQILDHNDPYVQRDIDQYVYGSAQLDLNYLLYLDGRFRYMDVDYVTIRARSDDYDDYVVLTLDGRTEDTQNLQQGYTQNYYLDAFGRNDRVGYDFSRISLLVYGRVFVESVGVKFRDGFVDPYPRRPLPPPRYRMPPRDPRYPGYPRDPREPRYPREPRDPRYPRDPRDPGRTDPGSPYPIPPGDGDWNRRPGNPGHGPGNPPGRGGDHRGPGRGDDNRGPGRGGDHGGGHGRGPGGGHNR